MERSWSYFVQQETETFFISSSLRYGMAIAYAAIFAMDQVITQLTPAVKFPAQAFIMPSQEEYAHCEGAPQKEKKKRGSWKIGSHISHAALGQAALRSRRCCCCSTIMLFLTYFSSLRTSYALQKLLLSLLCLIQGSRDVRVFVWVAILGWKPHYSLPGWVVFNLQPFFGHSISPTSHWSKPK